MTFVVGVACSHGVWMCADRRLSDRPDDRAVKITIAFLGPTRALIGYAGLGARGEDQISNWVERAISGVAGPTYRHVMFRLAYEATRWLKQTAIRTKFRHEFLSVAVDSNSMHHHGYLIDVIDEKVGDMAPRPAGGPIVWMLGSGRTYGERRTVDIHVLRRLCARYVKGTISGFCVAKYLANLNRKVSEHAVDAGDNSVSPNCIVAWQPAQGGGGWWVFDRFGRLSADPFQPLIVANGYPASSIMKLLSERFPHILTQQPSDEEAKQLLLDVFKRSDKREFKF